MALEVNISKSQSEMDDQFVREYIDAIGAGGNFNEFLSDWGMSEEEVIDYLETNPQLLPEGFESHYEGDVGETDRDDRDDEGILPEGILPSEIIKDSPANVIDLSMPEDGKFAELTDEQIDNIQNFIPAARLGKVVKAGKSMFGDAMNKLFSSKALKTNQLTKGGKVGQRIEPGTISKNVAGTGLKPSVKQGTVDRYNKMADAVKKKRAIELGTTAAVATAIGLSGNRNKDGDFIEADDNIIYGHPELAEIEEDKIDLNTIAREDDSVGVEEPTGPDMVEAEERPGWKKNPGANWWSVNSKSDYWQTDDGAEEALDMYGEYPSWVKQPEVQELDWSSWFK
jgi:hypothetical protein